MRIFLLVITVLILFSSCPPVIQPPTRQESPGTLMITEVGSMYYYDVPNWFELYNNSAEVANIGDYTLRCFGLDTGSLYFYYIYTFTMPDIYVQPGSYIIIKGRPGTWLPENTSQVAYVSSGSYVPYWESYGYVEIVRGGQTKDFVRFGNSTGTPLTGGWSGTYVTSLPFASNSYGYSIARNSSNLDTDTPSDWTLRSIATPGGPNDVTNTTDADADGIPDSCEISNSTYAGLPLYQWGARTGRKDIFIHVNYMASSDPGITPSKEALDKVVAAFAAKNIAIHFDVGNLYGSGTNTNNHNLDDTNHQVPFSLEIAFGNVSGKANLYSYKNNYMNIARRQIFHYMLFANRQDSSLSSGVAEMPGNDVIITLGEWGLTNAPQSNLNLLINFQAGTIMHEFGHNLNLRHGGNVNLNYKPNYYSIMNYLYQLGGLPAIGTNEGDRYYQYHDLYGNLYGYDDLTNGPYTTNFFINYSDGTGGSITESTANETLGLRRTGSTSVDFNGDSNFSASVSYDLNGDGVISNSAFQDYNDWSNIDLFFQRNWQGDATGVTLDSSLPSLPVFIDKIGDDHQPVTAETLNFHTVQKMLRRK